MPLEVKELIIKVTVSDPADKAISNTEIVAGFEKMKKQIVAECCEKILDQLNTANER